MLKPLTQLVQNRGSVETVVGPLVNENSPHASMEAGQRLARTAAEYGLNVKDYLTLAIDLREGQFANDNELAANDNFTGWEASLAYLNLPYRDDLANGVVLDAASETFQTHPGTRALFPEVVDQLVRWKYRQDQFENIDPLIANSRTTNGVELISTVVDDEQGNYNHMGPVAELGRFRIRKIQTSETSVKYYKLGGGYEFSYEFGRRASLDLLTPFANRMERELQIGKVSHAVNMLVNGDSVHGAAGVVDQSSLKPAGGSTSAAGQINWEAFLHWLVTRAKAGTPVDTVVGNWDTYLQWQMMFAKPDISEGMTKRDVLEKAGANVSTVNPNLIHNIRFAVASAAPATKLVGFSRGDTLEELKESGSQIQESERAIQNQSVTVVRSENVGYRLAFGDTRSVLNLDAVA